MAPPVPKPDGGEWDDTKAAAGATTSGSAAKTLFDLGDLDPKSPLIIDYGRPASKLPRQLPQEDRDRAARAPSLGLPEDLLKNPVKLFATDKKAYIGLQRAMFAAGFYGSASAESIRFGADLTATQKAWLGVLTATAQAQAAGHELTPDDVISQSIEGRAAGETPGEADPEIIQLSDPRLIAGTAQKAAQSALGRNLDDGEIKSFIAHFQAEQSAYSKKRFAASQAKDGGSLTLTEPDLGAAATAAVEEGHGTEIAANNMADYIGVLERMLGGG